MPGLDSGIHEAVRQGQPYGCGRGASSWIAGVSPAMTAEWDAALGCINPT
jgi:hypothetical protein